MNYRFLNTKQFPRDALHGFVSVILIILKAVCVHISQNPFHISSGVYIWEGMFPNPVLSSKTLVQLSVRHVIHWENPTVLLPCLLFSNAYSSLESPQSCEMRESEV